MVMSKENYEDLRNKRLEENKRRMEELNLPHLTQALKTAHSPKPSPMKRAKPRLIGTEMVEVRRSSRVQSLPVPVYKEIDVYEGRVTLSKSGRKYSYSRKDLENRVYASDEARYWATTKAEELEASLEGAYPSFVKPMLQSHVTGGFWLGLPSNFCKVNLPRNDATVTLIDEDGDEHGWDEEDEVHEVCRSHPIGKDQAKRKAKARTLSTGSSNDFDVECWPS
nr:B3 domain-containing protein At3g19184-like [Tanacetum cinerariifolium]